MVHDYSDEEKAIIANTPFPPKLHEGLTIVSSLISEVQMNSNRGKEMNTKSYHTVSIQVGWPLYEGNVRCYCKGGKEGHRKGRIVHLKRKKK